MRILVASASLCAILLSDAVPAASARQGPPPPQTPHPCSLDGLWVGRTRDKDGVGLWLEFAPDGSVVRAQGRIADGGYSVKGDTLMLNGHVGVPNGKGAVLPGKLAQKISFRIAGPEMTRVAEQASVEAITDAPPAPGGRGGGPGDGAPPPVAPVAQLGETKLTRVKEGNPGDPLSGVWTWTSKSGRTVEERYSGKGRFAILEAMGGQKGTFTLEDGKLTVTAGGTPSTVSVTCTGGMWLNIETPNGPMRFLKFQ